MHRMTGVLGLVLALATLASPAAEVYKWVDQNGRVHYGDHAQPGWKKLNVTPGSGAGGPAAPARPASTETPDQQATRAASCERKKTDLETYRSAVRLVERRATGEESELTPEQRQKLIAVTEKQIGELCATAGG